VIAAILAGLAVGAVHAVTGPDHVAAVVPMSFDSPWKGARTGFGWGLGHGTGVVLLALVALAFREVIVVDVVAAWSELAVGALLLGIGAWVLRLVVAPAQVPPHDHARAAFGVGTLHGTAGMGHLVGLLPAMGLPVAQATAYLGAFLAGAAGAMTLVGLACGTLSTQAGPRLRTSLVTAAGIGAVAIGGWWVVGAVAVLG